MRLRRRLAAPFVSMLTVAGLVAVPAGTASADPPDLDVSVVRAGLSNPWAIAFTPAGSMLYTQRDAKTVTIRKTDGREIVLLRSPSGMWNGGETGLMGIEVAGDFATSRTFFTCHGYRSGSTQDVRVVAWRINQASTAATFVRNVVVGLPSRSGRHGGCALARGSSHALYIGTGDAAVGTAPQYTVSGGGKVLRVDARNGQAWPGNPFADSNRAMKRRVWTYGHRNVQGLARAADGSMWSVEHGSYRDDEVNRIVGGGNYGWNPVPRVSGDPSYNEGANSPMTDTSIRGARKAAWSSGTSTIAPSGAAFVNGAAWGELDGSLAMTVLKGQELRFLTFASGRLVRQTTELKNAYGRLRGARQGPDGALYVTTSNGSDDKILRIRPRT